MPTGYTADVATGKITTFKDFALTCARGFGALLILRDEPSDAPIPDELTPSDWHKNELEIAEAELKRLKNLTTDEKFAEYQKDCREQLDWHLEYERDKAERKQRYETMLDDVYSWNPPTREHDGLKAFMANQLKSSIDFDCSPSKPPELLMYGDWYRKALDDAQWKIDYHTTEYHNEVERCKENAKWIRDLKESLE